MIYKIYISSQLCSYNGYKLNSHLTCFQRGFIAQLVEVMGSNPFGHEAPGFFLGFLCNCFSYFIYNCEDHSHLQSLPTMHSNHCPKLKRDSRASENRVTDDQTKHNSEIFFFMASISSFIFSLFFIRAIALFPSFAAP